ncbi:alpha-mannosidase 2-like [Mercenaria mercenaria]|uniref:alpha-mannosidase 2-like n=1 Tax=Mercenaria mercenaria TaxID=6596 RepID=UPI00234FB2E2|nr:alpha-mannosidase 2-like [Mercenaria mercenaria]
MGINWTWNSVLDILKHFPGRGDFLQIDSEGPSVLYPNRSKSEELINDKLSVFVLLHSHNDPGYRHTLEDYYNFRAKKVLSLAVQKLTKYKDLTFIWTDTCFLERWWNEQNSETRNELKLLVQSGRFEIALGAWVSADECITHYFAYLDQLIEGYYWIRQHLGVFPKVSFNMDQFGSSASVNYIRSVAGIKITFLNHLHKGTKKYFRQHRLLEFYNRQLSDKTGDEDTFIHIEPFDDLSFKGSCGPAKMVCVSLDLRTFKLPHPDELSFKLPKLLNGMPYWNVHHFAEVLVSQMKIKSDGYLHNVLLLPLGNDILYHTAGEWTNQYRNLKILMAYINSYKPFKVHIQFGTIEKYYEEVMRQTKRHKIQYALAAGDYFPYTRGPKYWSGYFTTRQFMKRLGRELQESVRAVDLLMSFLVYNGPGLNKQKTEYKIFLSNLTYARRQLYIFQHHDAITGTAEEETVKDFKQRLSSALILSQEVMSELLKIALHISCTHTALRYKHPNKEGNFNLVGKVRDVVNISIFPTTVRDRVEELTKQAVLNVSGDTTKLIIFNSFTQKRRELITVSIKTKGSVLIKDRNDFSFDFDVEIFKDIMKVTFISELPPVGISVFNIVTNSDKTIKQEETPKKGEQYFVCQTHEMNLTCSICKGIPLTLCSKKENTCSIFQIDLLHYTPISDAYTFPDSGKYTIIQDYSWHRIINGKTFCSVEFFFKFVTVKYVLQNVHGVNGRRVQMEIHDNLSKAAANNFESQFAVRVKTNIENRNTYYTDSNGLQLMKRTFRKHLSFGANVYPMTSMAVIQDRFQRLTVHSIQPNGVVSRDSGSLDIMIDRVVTAYSDGTVREFAGNTNDNLPTFTKLYFQLEKSLFFMQDGQAETLQPSLEAVMTNDLIQHPVHTFFTQSNFACSQKSFSFLNRQIPSEMIIANMKCLIGDEFNLDGLSMTLLRRDVSINRPYLKFNPSIIFRNGSVTLHNMFKDSNIFHGNFSFKPLEMKTFLIK